MLVMLFSLSCAREVVFYFVRAANAYCAPPPRTQVEVFGTSSRVKYFVRTYLQFGVHSSFIIVMIVHNVAKT